MSAGLDLGIVVPVFNEEDHILSLIKDWDAIFTIHNISHRFFVVNDGSTDGSLKLLETLQDNSFPIEILSQTNQGHGPAILKGYARALIAEWVFQIDADHQYDVSAFADLWQHRFHYDFLLAERSKKNASLMRNTMSDTSKVLVRHIFGKGIRDVNSPYRLINSKALAEALSHVPKKSFAPNILLSAYFVFKRNRIYQTSVNIRKTAATRKSKMSSYLLKGSLMSLFQTIVFRFKI